VFIKVDFKPDPPHRPAQPDLPEGVYRRQGRPGCFAQVHIAGRNKYLGYFSDPQKAHEAYLAAKRERGR
jgi:hypothetical protein